MKKKVKFNLNNHVYVQLNDAGKKVLQDRHIKLNKMLKERGATLLPLNIKVDEEGYTAFQAWDFMETFGSHMGLLKENKFSLDILIEVYDGDKEKV